MKRYIYRTVVLLLLAFSFSFCSRENVATFDENESGIYFENKNAAGQYYDNYSYSFFGRPNDKFELELSVFALGHPKDFDRSYAIKQIKIDETDMVEGREYFLSSKAGGDKLIVPAEAEKDVLVVTLVRTAELEEMLEGMSLLIEFEATEHFKPIFRDETSSSKVFDRHQFTVSISDRATQPDNWDRLFERYFGAWGEEKYRFMIKTTGKTDWADVTSISNYDSAYYNALKAMCVEALDIYNETADEPLAEEDGTLVEF